MARALGPEVALMVDANSCFTVERAIEVGHLLQDHGISHYEEPCPYWELEQTQAVTAALDIDVSGGEQDEGQEQHPGLVARAGPDAL